MDEGRREGRRLAGKNVIAVKQHGGADTDSDSIDRGDDRLGVMREGIKEFDGVGRSRRVGLGGAVLQEVFEIVAGGKYADPPVMIMQRMPGLFCAVSIASLIARYISCVIAFFFSGRRSVITRVASSSVTISWPGMMLSFGRAACCRWRDFRLQLTSSRRPPQTGQRAFFRRRLDNAHKEHAMQLTGIHHLTAISAKPRDNLAFYTGLLGMRLVKKTVNQDDVSAYHLFYADGLASPGSDLTFFDFPLDPERRGANAISRTGLRVAGEKSLGYWRDRLAKAGGRAGELVEVDGRLTLPFEDGEGQRLVLVDDGGVGAASAWERSPVPAEHQIRGLGPIVLTVQNLARIDQVLTGVMNMRRAREYASPIQQLRFMYLRWGRAAPPPSCTCSNSQSCGWAARCWWRASRCVPHARR